MRESDSASAGRNKATFPWRLYRFEREGGGGGGLPEEALQQPD